MGVAGLVLLKAASWGHVAAASEVGSELREKEVSRGCLEIPIHTLG